MRDKESMADTGTLTMVSEDPPALGKLILEREFPSDEALVIPSVVRVMDFLIKDGVVREGDRNRVGLCLEEALCNAVIHGNGQNFKKMVRLKVFLDDTRWVVQVDDDGKGFRLEDVPNPVGEESLWGEGGRGLSLMALYMDEVKYYRGGRTLVMAHHL